MIKRYHLVFIVLIVSNCSSNPKIPGIKHFEGYSELRAYQYEYFLNDKDQIIEKIETTFAELPNPVILFQSKEEFYYNEFDSLIEIRAYDMMDVDELTSVSTISYDED